MLIMTGRPLGGADETADRRQQPGTPPTLHAQPIALRVQDIPPGLPLPGWDDLLVLATA
jgi:hypothetical protein